MINSAIAILGGGLANDIGEWRTTNFSEQDKFGALGDRLRVESAAVRFSQNPELLIIVLGGKGQYQDIPEAPAVAAVIKKELLQLGVPEHSIITEEQSGNTWQQLQALKAIINKENLTKLFIISNQYHLPRVQAMVNKDNVLQVMSKKGVLKLVSAEDILKEHDPARWQETIDKAYQTAAMKNRTAMEEDGVRQIKSGLCKLE